MAVRSVALMGSALLVALLSTGCMTVEENPLDVNSPRSDQQNVSAVERTEQTVQDFGDDPLNLADNGATLCTKQPAIGFQEFTVLVHNEALETFTFEDISLKDPTGLSIVSAEVSKANRDGHHKAHGGDGGADGGDHGGHSAAPAPEESAAAEPTGPVTPVPADGYNITTHEYVNLVVAVAIEEGAESGSAQGITVAYSANGQEFTGTHPLIVQLERESCA